MARINASNVRINGRRTSMRFTGIEQEVLGRICQAQNISVHEFCERAVNDQTIPANTAIGKVRSAMFVYLMRQWRRSAATWPPPETGLSRPW